MRGMAVSNKKGAVFICPDLPPPSSPFLICIPLCSHVTQGAEQPSTLLGERWVTAVLLPPFRHGKHVLR